MTDSWTPVGLGGVRHPHEGTVEQDGIISTVGGKSSVFYRRILVSDVSESQRVYKTLGSVVLGVRPLPP